jgi:hypothetical protein
LRSIQSLIFIRLFAIILIFFAVVSGFAYVLTAEAIQQFVVSDASTSLSFIVNNITANYKSELTALDQIASIHGFLPFEAENAHTIVKEFLELPNIFTTIHMYKVDGELLFAERRSSEGPYKPKPNFNLKEPEFIALVHKVIDEKRSLASPAFFTWKGELYQTYITPVFEDHQKQHVLGILSGGVFPHLKRIDYLLQGLKLAQNNFILITDSQGHFITSDGITEQDSRAFIKVHTDRATKQFYTSLQDQTGKSPSSEASFSPIASGTSSERKGTAQSPNSEKTPAPPTSPEQVNSPALKEQLIVDKRMTIGHSHFIVLSRPIADLKLIVTLGVNTQPIDQKTRELSYRLFEALIVGLLLSLFASVVVGEKLAKPFRDMAKTINDLNTGHFAARTEYSSDDEIGYLSKRINTLAEKIQKSEYLGNLWSNESELEEQQRPGTKE